MKLSIITINYNNAIGLKKTMESVLSQTSTAFEYIVVDGWSTDDSVQQLSVIGHQSSVISEKREGEQVINGITVRWMSEKDNGIYHAMNKGIRMAKGEYIQFLNSGDILAAPNVTERMLHYLSSVTCHVSIIYGNMLKSFKGKIICDKGFAGRMPTMLDFYTGTLNHSPAYIKRSLFDTYGLYDETLKIVSDWKWYLQVIVLGGIKPVYMGIDVTVFDMNGISNNNSTLDKEERRRVLEELLPLSVVADYDRWALSIHQMSRMNRYWLVRKGFWLVERVLFKWEKIF